MTKEFLQVQTRFKMFVCAETADPAETFPSKAFGDVSLMVFLARRVVCPKARPMDMLAVAFAYLTAGASQ